MQPPNVNTNNAAQQDFAARKAVHDAINAELKTGNASIDKIKDLLKSAEPNKTNFEDQEVDRLAKIHDILTADQRKTFIANQNNNVLNHAGGHGPMGGGMDMGRGGFPIK